MPRFNDSENIVSLVPEGDYVFCVVGFECKISNGPKTRGSDQFDLELEIEPTARSPQSKCFDSLIDHENSAWKIDCFLKSCGIKLAKGEAFEFREDLARQRNCKWINPLGLRGWCRLMENEYTPQGSTAKRKNNKVAIYYTDKPKLPARVIEQQEEDQPF